jgi:hypothetical protein
MNAGSPVTSMTAVMCEGLVPSEPDTKTVSPFFKSLTLMAGKLSSISWKPRPARGRLCSPSWPALRSRRSLCRPSGLPSPPGPLRPAPEA